MTRGFWGVGVSPRVFSYPTLSRIRWSNTKNSWGRCCIRALLLVLLAELHFFFFLIKGPVFAVQTRPWLFSEGGVGDVMLLQKVGSAYAKTAMCFRIQRESPRGCGVTSHISLIQCYPSSAFMNYVAIHTHGFFVCGVVSCPDLQRGVIKCSIFTGRSCVLFMCAFI